MKTIRFVLGATTKLLEERGFRSPRLDAEVLLAHALGTGRVTLYTDHDRPLAEPELERYRELVRRRLKHEPVAYLVGKREFHGVELAVDARVLVPRPETEHLVEEALRLAGPGDVKVADVATGSGAVALALAKALGARGRVFASDVSAAALEVARANAARLGLEVTLVEGDLGAPLGAFAPFDVVAANLPYLTAAEMAALDADVAHEPRLALAGGPDGLDLVRRLVPEVRGLLAPGGGLCLEIGPAQAEATAALLGAAGYAGVRVLKDLEGRPRVVSGTS